MAKNSAAVIGAPTDATVTEDETLQTLMASGAISISDVNVGQAGFKTAVSAASGTLGKLVLQSNGSYTYSVDNAKTQYLGAGQSKTESFTVTSLDGTQKQIVFTIFGINDAAAIGTPTVVDVFEDAKNPTLKAAGSISIFDADQGQAAFKTVVGSASGNLGVLVLQSNGSYTYSVANGAAQSLGAGDVRVDTFTVTALDGTQKQVSFKVHGINDAAVIGIPTVRDVTEDAANPSLTATGSISISDVDQGESAFNTAVTSAAGTLGNLVISANGTYTYSVANGAAQYLGADDVKVDTFTINAIDGTQKQVSFTIHGSNDAAVIGVPTVHDVTESATSPLLLATGTVSIADADQGESVFRPALLAGAANLGTLVIGSDGAYVYGVLNSAVKHLDAGEVKIDTFTLTALDGTQKQVSFTIHGTGGAAANQAAVIGNPDHAVLVEDSAPATLSVSGTIPVSDADAGQAAFQTATISAAGNLGTLTLGTDGSYTYSIANGAVQYLGAGQSRVETFTVKSADGTAKDISFTIKGTNDVAVIGDPVNHDVTEDTGASTLTATGQIAAIDADQNQSSFQAGSVAGAGNFGTLAFAADGTYTYSVANAATQGLGAGDVKIDTFTVAALDGSPKVISFTIHGTQDAPVLQVATTSGAADDATIPLSLSAYLVDASGTLGMLVITGIPAGYTLNHGNFVLVGESGGYWEVPSDAATLSALALVPGPGAHLDTLSLHISVASIEGGHQALAEADLTVNVAAGAGETSNRALDGYIAGAFVFADANGNGVFDQGEASATTKADGSFTLQNAQGTLIMSGGTDVSTGLAFTGTLKAPAGSTVVSPLTTLVTSLAVGGVTAAEAAAQVATAFGIDPDQIDIMTFDPVPAAVAGSQAATAVLSAGVQVQSTIAQMSAVGVSAADVVAAIADAIANPDPAVELQAGETILTSSASVQSIATNSGVSEQALQTVTEVVQAANTSIQTAENVTEIAQAGQVAQGDAAASLAAITDFTDTAQTSAVTQTYVAELSVQVNEAVVAGPAGPVFGTTGADVLSGTALIDTIDGLEGNDRISGADGADMLFGGLGNDRLTGNAGNDILDGGQGFDRAVYADATGGVTVAMAAGTASGAGVGADALSNIESVVGSDFADTYNAAGFTGDSATPGTPVGFNEFEGGAGNDTVVGTVNAQGAALTRVSYVGATAGVIVDLAAGTADGDASVGHDNLSTTGILAAWGSNNADTLLGSANANGSVEVFAGFAGNDLIDGRGGFDRADYNTDPATTSGIDVHLAAGTVTGDATVGTDTLRSVEAVRGTNFADAYDATGFAGNSANGGSNGTFNEFTGNGGNDVVTGNGNTRLGFNNATGGVTVDIQAGTADGDASVGHDAFTGVNAVQGSVFADTLRGDANANTFTGNGGNDLIDGRGGFDVASYNNIYFTTGPVAVNMAAGTVTGDASVGTDTLRSIEGVQGTGFADTYDATGFGAAGAANAGNNGTFNQFEGVGGNDIVIGNGNTRVIYGSAAGAVTVDLALGTARGTAPGDAANVGTDTFTGVFSATGSAFGDTLIGDAGSNMFVGGGGNDTIDGGAGADVAIFSGGRGQYTVTVNGAQTTVTGPDGTDTLTAIEVLQFTNANVLVASGSQAAPVDLSDGRLFFNASANPLVAQTGSADDYVRINQGLSGHLIDLGNGIHDTVMLGVTGGYNLAFAGVERLVGTSGNDFVGFLSTVNGLAIDMGGGTDTVNLANGANSVAADGIENLNGSNFAPNVASNDTLTLLNNVSGLTVNLGQGTNTLNLAAGANALVSAFGVNTIHSFAGDDALAIANGISTPADDAVVDLGGGDDTLTLGGGFSKLGLLGVEHLEGDAQNNFVALNNSVLGLTVDLGGGNDALILASGTNSVALNHVESVESADAFGGSIAASNDTLTLLNNVDGVIVNLQQGDNTLKLAAGTNAISAYNVQHINGTSSDDVLTMLNDAGGDAIDLGAGDDTLNLTGFNGGVSVANVEHVNGGAFTDIVTIAGATGATVTGGGSSDFITAGAGNDVIRYTDASDSSPAYAPDTVTAFDAAHDTFLLDGVAGLAGSVHFQASGVLAGSPAAPHATAVLVNSGGQDQLQIDVDGDGTIGAADLVVNLNGLVGTLSDANFAVVTPNHAPTDIVLSGAPVAENSPAGTLVGILSDIDADAGDSASYSLTDDAGGLFAMSNGTIVTAAPLDYEQAASHQISVQVTDRFGATFSKNLQIDVANANEAPNVIALAGGTVAENAAAATVVGTVTATDPDAGATPAITLVDDAGGRFALSGSSLVTTGPLDFEQGASYQVTVRATDAAGLSLDQILVVAVSNANEAPAGVQISGAAVAENAAAGTAVGTLSATDPDAADTAAFTLVGNVGNLFAISNGQLVTTASLDFEAGASHQVTVRATDAGGLFHDTILTIATTNVNEAPTAIALSSLTVAASSAPNTVVGSLSVADPDGDTTFTYALLDDDGGLFALDGGNLVVAGSLGNVTVPTQHVTVRATDAGGQSRDQVLSFTVTGIAPTSIGGDAGDNTLTGTSGNDRIQGFDGNDTIVGGAGFDRAVYSDAGGGIVFSLASGTVTGPGVGTDSLTGIESIVGTNFADTFDPTGFTGFTGLPGSPIGFNEFEGLGGDDTITGISNAQGAPLTRVSYLSATAGVTVDLAGKFAQGDASVGHDTFVGNGVSSVFGSGFADTLRGSSNANGTVEVFEGRGGNDVIDGAGGFDRADYISDTTTTSGITVNLAAGSVTGDATVGTDQLISVEAVRGTAFVDTYNAAGFGAGSANAGSNGTFNEFTGGAGDDLITGNGATRLSYNNATAGIVFDIGLGTTIGDGSVGTDHFTGVNAVQATMFDDTLSGGATNDVFSGLAGNDAIDGRGGFDTATYYNVYFVTGGININMTTGQVTGDGSTGTDTLRSIEGVQGTTFADTYTATNFGAPGFINPLLNNVGNNQTFNQFEGMAGNDTITGNGNTRLLYGNATAGVTVSFTGGAGTAVGNVGSVGTDTFTGVNSITGSGFADSITADAANNVLDAGAGDDTVNAGGGSDTVTGGAGNDAIDGGGGADMAVFSGPRANYTITFSYQGVAGRTQVIDNVGTDGTDVLNGVEVLQFGNAYVMAVTGSSGSPINVSGLNFGGNANTFFGTNNAAGDFLAINQGLSGHVIDLQGGADTLTLTVTGGYTFGLANVENLVGTGGNDFVGLTTAVTGLNVDLGGGNDNLNVSGTSSVNLTGVETVGSQDFSGPQTNETLTLLNAASGLTVNLQQGDNTLNLAAGANNFVDIYNVQHINGTASDDILTLTDTVFALGGNPIVNLGDGNDVFSFGSQFESLTAVGIERINGNGLDNGLTLNAAVAGMVVDLGGGNDNLGLAAGANSLTALNIENIGFGDFAPGSASDDTLTLLNQVSGLSVNFGNGHNTLNLAAGSNGLNDVFNANAIHGTESADTLSIAGFLGTSNFDVVIDLGGGDDTLNIAQQTAVLNVVGVEHVNGNASDNYFGFEDNVTGIAVDLGEGVDNLSFANGVNSASVFGVEQIGGSDFTGTPSDDTLTLLNQVSGLSVNLGPGDNTLNLSAGTNSLDSLAGIATLHGSATDDVLTVTQSSFATVFDMGGGNDVLNFGDSAFATTVVNVETVNGSAQSDFITIGNTAGETTVTGGLGSDQLVASAATDNFRFTSAADSASGTADTVVNFDAASDSFTFANMNGPGGFNGATSIHFIDTAAFGGTSLDPHCEARVDQSGGNATLQIDVDGDGQMGAADMEIVLNNYSGTLTDSHFHIV